MVFSSYNFLLLFLPVLVVVYFLVPADERNIRNNILLLFSLLFYGWSNPKYLLLLCASILINWSAGFLLGKAGETKDRHHLRKPVLVLAVVCNLLLLFYFKYTDFFIENINAVLKTHVPLRHIALPVGISFFTFQGMSYVFDVYRNKAPYQRDLLKVALYISLFPVLLSGPILRFAAIAPQLTDRKESMPKAVSGVRRFVIGLAKKLILADTFALIADQAFSGEMPTTVLAWLGAAAYTLQIYFDFSGYSDMAIGIGRIFGFSFDENFNYPYISSSVTEFWRRWHISLSGWFRDYVYIPLGGNRCSAPRHLFNLFIVWLLTGFWHGAAWNFILWGMYYLVWLILDKYFLDRFTKFIPKPLRVLFTMLIVTIGWVLFRAESLPQILMYLKAMFGAGAAPTANSDAVRFLLNYRSCWLIGIPAVLPCWKALAQKLSAKYESRVWFTVLSWGLLLALFFLCLLYILGGSYNSFIYFQF